MDDFPYEHIKDTYPSLYRILRDYWDKYNSTPIGDFIYRVEEQQS